MAASGLACRESAGAGPPACKAAIREHANDAVNLCRASFARAPTPTSAGWIARALADHGATVDEVRAIAERTGDQPGGAEAWNAVGDAWRVAGKSRESVEAYERALAHRAVDDRRGRIRDAVALQYQHAIRDEVRAAMSYAGLAYNLATRDGDRELRAYVLASVAGLLFDVGALPAVEALVIEADKVTDEASPYYPALCQLHGLIDLSHGRPALARQQLTRAVELADARGLPVLARDAKLSLVAIALQENDPGAAARFEASDVITADDNVDDRTHHAYCAALIAEATHDDAATIKIVTEALVQASPGWSGSLEALRGAALIRSRQPVEAETSLLRAISSVERRRADLDLDELKPWLIQSSSRWPFEDLFALYVEQHRWADAFDIAQRATARSVLDGLLAAKTPTTTKSLESELDRAGDRIEGLRALTHSLRSSASMHPAPAADLLHTLGDRHVFTYFRSRTELWLIASGHELTILPVGVVADLAKQAESLLANPDDREIATALGRELLPEQLLPPRGAPLYIVVDEPIAELPFAALRIGDELAIERNTIAYAPSAAVLAQIVRSPAASGPRIVVGDPRGDLPGARLEANEVAATLATTARVGSAATAAMIREATSVELLHVAAHTERTALGPALAFADHLMTAGDIVDRGLPAGTVVLTSCASADAHDRSELGPIAVAFLAAGAHAVVASRWAVDDGVARTFARDFYAADGLRDPVAATASAQREMIRGGVPPSAWATFVVLGEGAPNLKGDRR